jgi:hypothetical protein
VYIYAPFYAVLDSKKPPNLLISSLGRLNPYNVSDCATVIGIIKTFLFLCAFTGWRFTG